MIDSEGFDLAHCRVAGAMVLPRGRAPFDRGALVLEERVSGATRYGRVRSYATDSDLAHAAPLTLLDWGALLASGQARRIDALQAVRGAAMWVLNDPLLAIPDGVRVLRTSSVMTEFGYAERECVIVEDAAALAARDAWARDATADAEVNLRRGNTAGALRDARLAFCAERSMSPERVGTLVAAYRALGWRDRADGYLQMAENSRGREFAESARDRADSLGAKST